MTHLATVTSNKIRSVLHAQPKHQDGTFVKTEGVTLVVDVCGDMLHIYHAECVGSVFDPEVGVQIATAKPAERFPYNPKYPLISHVVYMLTKAKRQNMAHLQPLRKAMQKLLEVQQNQLLIGTSHD